MKIGANMDKLRDTIGGMLAGGKLMGSTSKRTKFKSKKTKVKKFDQVDKNRYRSTGQRHVADQTY